MTRVTAIRTCFAALLALACAAAAQPTRIRTVARQDVRHVVLPDVAAFYGMRYARKGKQTTLASRYSRLVFTDSRRACVINGVQMHLAYAPAVWEGKTTLSLADFRLMLEPILRSKKLPRQAVRTVVIDPGHGGKDPGTSKVEKTLTLQLAKRLAALLRADGFQVQFTRTTDRTTSYASRTKKAREKGADLFVSIHCNYVDSASVSGVETFILTPKNTPSTYGTTARTSSSTGNGYDAQNVKLAYEVQKYVLHTTSATDRGVKRANFAVLRSLSCPGLLIETGFLSNAKEGRLLRTAAYQDKVVRGIAYGVRSYANAVAPPTE